MCTLPIFSVVKSNLFIRALLLDRILVTEKTTRTPHVHLVFTGSHKDDSDMLRQMRMLYARSNRLVRLFHSCSRNVLIELGRSFCGSFYCSYLWTHYNKASFSKIRVAYNDLYRKILHVSRRSSASVLLIITFSRLNA